MNKFIDITNSIIKQNIINDRDENLMLQTEKHLNENDFDSFLSSSTTVFREVKENYGNYGKKDELIVAGMDQANIIFQLIMRRNAPKSLKTSDIGQIESSEGKEISENNFVKTGENMSILGLFCAEGDNRPDGKKLASIVLSGLNYTVIEHSLPHPASWNVLYGAPISSDSMSMFY